MQKMMIRLLMTIVGVAAIGVGGHSTPPAHASHSGSAAAFSIDLNPAASPVNTATTLGSREGCAEIWVNGLEDGDEDDVDAVQFDVTVTGVPASAPMTGYEFALLYDESSLSVLSTEGGFFIASNANSWAFHVSDDLPDTDGNGSWVTGEADLNTFETISESGSGVLQRVVVGADVSAQTGVYDLLLAYSGHMDENNDAHFPDSYENARLAVNVVCPPADSDEDKVYDVDETQCGSDPNNAASRPERIDGVFAGVSDDGDAEVDEALPSNIPMADCDGDGFPGPAEAHVYSPNTQGDQDPCGSAPSSPPFTVPIGWPGDLNGNGTSANRVTLADVTSFTVPVRRLDTSPGDANYDVRWDIVPGNSGQAKDINSVDQNLLTAFRPAMFAGAKAFNGPVCPWPP